MRSRAGLRIGAIDWYHAGPWLLPIHLNEAEEAGLRNSAETIRSAIRSVGF